MRLVHPALALGLLLGSLTGACKSAAPEAEPAAAKPSAAPAPVTDPAGGRKAFGSPLGKSPSAALADVLKQPDKYENQTLLVEGDVRRACSRKGCWMELSQGPEATAPGCRVTFKDYGFFVPTDSAGSKARVEATVQSSVLKASHVSHMEEEGAQFPDKAADGTAREVRLVATGVELWR